MKAFFRPNFQPCNVGAHNASMAWTAEPRVLGPVDAVHALLRRREDTRASTENTDRAEKAD
jgi:hypothetical protein